MADMKQDTGGVQFRKTKLCRFQLLGMCRKRNQCTFAHEASELLPMPDFRGTKMCKEFAECGICSKDDCSFAHTKTERRQAARRLARFYQSSTGNSAGSRAAGASPRDDEDEALQEVTGVSSAVAVPPPCNQVPLPWGLLSMETDMNSAMNESGQISFFSGFSMFPGSDLRSMTSDLGLAAYPGDGLGVPPFLQSMRDVEAPEPGMQYLRI